MNPYVQLFLAAMLPVAASVLLYLADHKTPFRRLPYWAKQGIFGLIFGALAIIGTEYGIIVLGVTMNVRDAAPICAGLIFGAPAGIISGVIGGVERFLAASWGAGEYTKIACTAATIFAGCFAAWLRRYMFDDKKPAWFYGLAAGAIVEVFHMLLVFLTHLDDGRTSFAIVQKCAIPMILMTALGCGLATLLVSLLGREKLHQPPEKTKISQTFQSRLLNCVIVAFFLTSLFTALMQKGISSAQTDSLLSLNINDVKADINDASDENMLATARSVMEELSHYDRITSPILQTIAEQFDVAEINLVNERGVIAATTYEAFLAYNMASGVQSGEFLVLLDGETKEFVQRYQPTSFDRSLQRKYAAVALDEGGFVQVGYDFARFQREIGQQVVGATRNRHVGEKGFLIICDEDFSIVSDPNNNEGESLLVTGMFLDLEHVDPGQRFQATVYGEDSYCMYTNTEGYYIISVLPLSEANLTRDISVYITVFLEVLVFTALFIMVYFLIKKLIVDNIRKVNRSLAKITGGNLQEEVDVRVSEEFASLSDDINSTMDTLRRYIGEAEARIDKELEFARTIQLSSLPNIFPPYPNRDEFDIWAGTLPAKEVGGDFYDFYLLGEDRLVFLIADVSGKGIPAAMFMMTAKTTLKNLTESGLPVEEVLTRANEQLCANNEAGMFVTVWMGILNLRTGLVTYASAGHNPPVVRRKGSEFEYLRGRPGFVLAGMEGVRYRSGELQLQPGDVIFLYTDGVTEATNEKNELYGEERLLRRLNMIHNVNAETMSHAVKTDVDTFVRMAPQFDDITMLCLKYKKYMGGTEE